MKLTLILENETKLTSNVEKTVAYRVLGKFIELLMPENTDDEDTPQQSIGFANESTKSVKTQQPENANESTTGIPKVEIKNTTVDKGDQKTLHEKYVVHICGKCDQQTVRKVAFCEGEKALFRCHFCRDEIEIERTDIAVISCPNCFSKYHTNIMNNHREVLCKDCKSPIDLRYNDKKRIYETV